MSRFYRFMGHVLLIACLPLWLLSWLMAGIVAGLLRTQDE